MRPSDVDLISRYWEAQLVPRSPASSDDTVLVRIVFPSQDAALHQLVAWGTVARIVEPAAIRDELVARARTIVEHHG